MIKIKSILLGLVLALNCCAGIPFDGDPMGMIGMTTAVWTPLSISGCQLWLDAADASTFTLSDTNVVVWADKSGAGVVATNSDATARPVYVAGLVNGRAVVNFDGKNDRLFLSSDFVCSNATIFTVFSRNPATNIVEWVGRSGSFSGQFAFEWLRNNTMYLKINSQIATINNQTESGIFVGDINIFGASWTNAVLRINRAIKSTTVVSTTTPNIIYNLIGYGDGNYHNGFIAEMIIYNSSLSAANVDTVEAYLYGKWK